MVAINGVDLDKPYSKMSFDMNGYVDFEEGHVNYHSVPVVFLAQVPVGWREKEVNIKVSLPIKCKFSVFSGIEEIYSETDLYLHH